MQIDSQTEARGTSFTLGVIWFGYACALLGLLVGLSWAFGWQIPIKGHTLPGEWRLALLGLLGGGLFALLGHWMESLSYRHLVERKGWIPWLIWSVLPLVCLVAMFWGVGGF